MTGTMPCRAVLCCLQDSLQTAKGPVLPDSSILLLRIQAPVLFIQAASDTKSPTEQMRRVAAQMKPAAVPRLVEVADVSGTFMSGEPPAVQPSTIAAVTGPLVQFVEAVGDNKLDSCSLPLANPPGTAAAELPESSAAGIKAQIQILDADDTLIYDVEPLGKPGEPPGGANGGQQHKTPQQQLLQQQLQLQVLQQQQAQQAHLAAAAAKAGINMQQAAAQRVAAAAAAAGGKIPLNLAAAAAAAAAGGAAGAAAASGAPVVAPMMMPGGFTQITPQMLAAAQAMQLAAAKQGIRPGAPIVLPAGAAVVAAQQQAAAAQQQQQQPKGA